MVTQTLGYNSKRDLLPLETWGVVDSLDRLMRKWKSNREGGK